MDPIEPSNRPKIVAVFGGNTEVSSSVLEAARWAAGHIADRRDFLTLTGARKPDSATVKGVAAGAAIDKGWIGVHNCPDGVRPAQPRRASVRRHRGRAQARGRDCTRRASRHAHYIVLHPIMADRRNFLEALLCDGAVIFPGGNGTVSEAVSM